MALRKWLPPAIWMALIFEGSTDALSGEHTSHFVVPLLRWLSAGKLTPAQLELGHLLIRKAGHLIEYGVLSILFWFALRPPRQTPKTGIRDRGPWVAAGLAVLLTVGYAAADEYHQSFVPSRTSSWHDVAIDAAGGVAGLALLGAVRLGLRRWRSCNTRV